MSSTKFNESCDFAVVGSGAAGGIAACLLAEAGFEVVVLEEGSPVDRLTSAEGAGVTLARWFREGGTQVAEGRSFVPILQGRCLGGGTTINAAICWRLPEDVYERAFGEISEHIPRQALEAGWDEIEADLSVQPVQEAVLGRNSALLREGCGKLGWAGHVIRRNESGCLGTANCMQACPAGKKKSADLTYLPRAEARGARIRTGWEVIRVKPGGGKHSPSLVARATRDCGQAGTLSVTAKRGVLLAASATQSPCILRRSGLGNWHVGRHFRAHPGAAALGLYDEPVKIWEGATQGFEMDHYRQSGRFKLETLALPIELGAARLPGVGARLIRALEEWGFVANWAVQVRAETEGTVRPRSVFPGSCIRYSLQPEDLEVARAGVRATCELFFASGAKEVIPAIYGLPERLTSPDQLNLIDEAPLDPRAWTMVATHLFGTCRMNPDPALGAVNERFEVHGAPGIFVVDSSVFPNNLGVNPQHTIMAVARHAARTLIDVQS